MKLLDTGELQERARRAEQRLGDCDLCARYCRVDRRTSIRGRHAGRVNAPSCIPSGPTMAKKTACAAGRIGHDLLLLVQPALCLLSKLGDQLEGRGPRGHEPAVGPDNARSPGDGLPQHQLGKPQPRRGADPGRRRERRRARAAAAARLHPAATTASKRSPCSTVSSTSTCRT